MVVDEILQGVGGKQQPADGQLLEAGDKLLVDDEVLSALCEPRCLVDDKFRVAGGKL